MPRESRLSLATDESLDWAARKASDAERCIEDGDQEAVARIAEQIARSAVGGWSLTAPSNGAATECSQEFRKDN